MVTMKSILISLVFVGIVLAQAQDLPDSSLTPGSIFVVLKDTICVSGYSAKVRNVPVAVKKIIFKFYNIPWSQRADYEVDHLIPLCLGGNNSLKNLWPQSYKSQWSAHMKDRLEVRLRRLVCTGHITLKQAQDEIAHDWIATFNKYVIEKERGDK